MQNDISNVKHYLTFYLNDKPYAISVLKIVEVQEEADITRVPLMPEHIKGVLNLRGSVVPVMDLRSLLEMEVDKNGDTHVVILELTYQTDKILIGGLVDRVDEVREFKQHEIAAAPDVNQSVDSRFIQGMVEREDDILIILDIERVVGRLCFTRVTDSGEGEPDFIFAEAGNAVVDHSQELTEEERSAIQFSGNEIPVEHKAPIAEPTVGSDELAQARATAAKLEAMVSEAEEKQVESAVIQSDEVSASSETVESVITGESEEAPPAVKKKSKKTRKKPEGSKGKKSKKPFTPEIPKEDEIDELD